MIYESKNTQACEDALARAQNDHAHHGYEGVSGLRGIVNARAMGLSKNKPGRLRSSNARRLRARLAKRVEARFSTAESRAGKVRGKHLPLRPAGYARKKFRAKMRFLADYLKNHPNVDMGKIRKDLGL